MNLVPLFVFWCLWYLNFSTRTVFSPLLPLIEDSLSLSHGATGGLLTSYAAGYALALLMAGRFVSGLGYRRVVVAGYVGMGLVLCCFHWAQSYLAFHILIFCLGYAAGTYMPSILSIITETYDQRHWGKAIGIHDSAASLSIFSMPLFITLGLRFLPWRTLLLILGLACLVLPAFFLRVSKEPRHDRSIEAARYMDLFRSRITWIMGLLWMVSGASNLGVYSILPLYLVKERGMDFSFANTLLGISRVGGLPVAVLAGFMADRYGYRRLLYWTIASTGLSTILVALSSNLTLMLISLILQATLSLAFFPVGLSAISKLTPLRQRSLTLGLTLALGVILGTGGGPFVLGLVADHLSFRTGIFWLGVVTALSSLAIRLLKDTGSAPSPARAAVPVRRP
jgi:MFS family permease